MGDHEGWEYLGIGTRASEWWIRGRGGIRKFQWDKRRQNTFDGGISWHRKCHIRRAKERIRTFCEEGTLRIETRGV